MLRRAEAASGTIMLVFRLSRYTGSNVKLLPKAMMLQFLGAGVGAASARVIEVNELNGGSTNPTAGLVLGHGGRIAG